ncbi:MAG: cytochrome P450 [Pseudomonadota bacterium]
MDFDDILDRIKIFGVSINDLLCALDSDDDDDEETPQLGPILTEFDAITGDSPQEIAGKQVMFARGQIRDNALPFFKELRDHRPITRAGPIWLVSRFDDVEEILHRETVFSVKSYLPRMMGVIGPFVLSQDITPQYDRDISIMRLVVKREDLERVRAITSRAAGEIVANMQMTDGPHNVVQELTRIVPLRLAAEYYGFTGVPDDQLKGWARACFFEFFVNLDNNPDIRAAAVAAGAQMRPHLEGLIADAKARASGDTVLDRLVALQGAGPTEAPSDEDIIRTMMGLLVGMVETTSQAAIQALLVLAKKEQLVPAVTAARTGDAAGMEALIWEALRYRPVNPLVVRITNENYTLGAGQPHETTIPAGSMVFALTWSAMHDRRKLGNPMEFEPGRPTDQYLHFATGHHACFGRYISQVQITEILMALLRADIQVAGAPVYAGPFPEELPLMVS